MKLLFLLVVLGYFAVTYGQVSGERVPLDDVNKVCVSSDPEVPKIKYNETITLPKKCVRASCSPGTISFAGCGKRLVEPPCTLGPEDLTKPYPECCSQPVCP